MVLQIEFEVKLHMYKAKKLKENALSCKVSCRIRCLKPLAMCLDLMDAVFVAIQL